MMQALKLVFLLFILSLWLPACSTMKSSEEGDSTGQKGSSGISAQHDGAQTSGVMGSSIYPRSATARSDADEPWNDPSNPLSNRTIYFQFDSIEVQPEFRPVITTHAEFLTANPQLSVVMEGHADERGTREYNIALGEQRARAISKMMKLHGVRNSQIQFVSYGEEKPARLGHDEQAWRLNRRVEIIYPER